MKRVLLALLCACTFMLTGCFEEEGSDQGAISLSIPEQIIDQGDSFPVINLNQQYLTGITPAEVLSWEFPEAEHVKMTYANGMLGISVKETKWFGSDTVSINMEVTAGEFLSFAAIFTVEKKNFAPYINKEITDQAIKVGGSFKSIDLSKHVIDPDGEFADITWGVSSNIGANSVATVAGGIINFIVDSNTVIGTDTAFISGVDLDGMMVRDTVLLTITDNDDLINEPPVIKSIPEQKIIIGGTFSALNMAEYVKDPDGDDNNIEWSVSSSEILRIKNNLTEYYAEVKDETWIGSENITFTAKDEDGKTASVIVTFTVTEGGVENVAPVITKQIPDQVVMKGSNFSPVTLANHVDDPDGENTKIVWTHTTPVNYNTGIVAGQFGVIVKDTAWVGSETIILTATDEDGLTVNDTVTFTVTEGGTEKVAPVITPLITNQSVKVGTDFAPIYLSKHVTDADGTVDAIVWTTTTPVNFNTGMVDGIFGLRPKSDVWTGSETITFTATDADGLSDECTVTFTVLPDDGKLPPVITQIPNQVIDKGGKFTTIDLTQHVNDPDGDNAAITWDIVGPTTVNVVKILNGVTVTVVDPEWSGTAAVTFTATDADGLKASCITKFKVNGGIIIIPSNTWVFDKNKVKNTIQYSSTNPLIGQIPPTIDSTENPATDTTEILETTSDSITLYAKQDAVTAKSKYGNGLKIGEGLLAGVGEQIVLDSLNANSDVIAEQIKAGFPVPVEELTITFTDVTITDPELIELDNELRVEYTVVTTADISATMMGMVIPITAEITTENISYYVVYAGPIPPVNWPQTIIEVQ